MNAFCKRNSEKELQTGNFLKAVYFSAIILMLGKCYNKET